MTAIKTTIHFLETEEPWNHFQLIIHGNRKRLKDEVYLLHSSLERALKRRRGTEYH